MPWAGSRAKELRFVWKCVVFPQEKEAMVCLRVGWFANKQSMLWDRSRVVFRTIAERSGLHQALNLRENYLEIRQQFDSDQASTMKVFRKRTHGPHETRRNFNKTCPKTRIKASKGLPTINTEKTGRPACGPGLLLAATSLPSLNGKFDRFIHSRPAGRPAAQGCCWQPRACRP